MKRFVVLLLLCSALLPAPVLAKRLAAPILAPMEDEGKRYTLERSVEPKTSYHYHLRCTDNKTQQILWETPLYEVILDPRLESDVQDVPVREMKKNGKEIELIDEAGTHYRVEKKSGALLAPETIRRYSRESAVPR